MKAEELMIGDWVMLPECFIRRESKVTDVGQWVEVEDGAGVYGPEELSPIPITPEILEKNGFAQSIHYPCLYIFDEDLIRISINMDNGIYLSVIVYFEDGSEEFNCLIPQPLYVHQLQHALRICGINKEIVL